MDILDKIRLSQAITEECQEALVSITVHEAYPPKVLFLVHDWLNSTKYKGLQEKFDISDDKLADFIKSHTEWAFQHSLVKIDEDHYALNIANKNLDRFFNGHSGNRPLESNPEYINEQLTAYLPIIQKFIADAITDALDK